MIRCYCADAEWKPGDMVEHADVYCSVTSPTETSADGYYYITPTFDETAFWYSGTTSAGAVYGRLVIHE